MRTLSRSTVAASIVVVLLSISCEGDYRLPTEPPAPAGKAFIWGHVVEESGVCIVGAVVEIVKGPNAGQKFVQDEPCTVWDSAGFIFDDLPLGVPMTLRATREGFHPQEREVSTYTSGAGTDIVLRKE